MTTCRAAAALTAVLALALAGCSSGTTEVEATTSAPSVTRAAATPTPAASTKARAAFLAAFRKAYPELAANRRDQPIINDINGVCHTLTEGKTDAEVLKYVQGRFVGQDGTEPTTVQAKAILDLVRPACG